MHQNNLRILREKFDYTQKMVAEKLGCPRPTYNNYEISIVMIPLDILDKLSLIYNVPMSYILGIKNSYDKNIKIQQMNYDKLIDNLLKLKEKNNQTYEVIAKNINCHKTTCIRYYNKKVIIPIDRLILLSKLYNIDIDVLCNKISI